MKFSLVLIVIFGTIAITGIRGLKIHDCLDASQSTVCYYCDSEHDRYCGDPFQYSHYYVSKDVYLTECQGCCIKIVYPSHKGSQGRIIRSCTETLPSLNFTLEEQCNGNTENSEEKSICLCNKELCNKSTSVSLSKLLILFISVTFFVF